MTKFSELGITSTINGFVGDKIKMSKVLNKEIKILDYKIENSKINNPDNTKKCLYMQIEFEGEKRVIFTSGICLINVLNQVPKNKFPFETTIVREQGDMYEFS